MQRQIMEFLNSKQRKQLFGELEEQYGYDGPTDIVLFEGSKDKYYIITRDIEGYLDLPPLQGGLYVMQRVSDGIRLSMDGAMRFGPHCTAPRIRITPEQRDVWMKGFEPDVNSEDTPWRLVECEGDILGCSKVKDGYLLQYVPKGRRILEPHV